MDNREQILSRVEKALARSGSTHTLADVVAALKAGEMQSFWNDTSIVITNVMETPQKRYASVFLSAGDLSGVMSLHDEILDWAKSNNLDFARITVRPGFERLLKKKGWKRSQIEMELKFNG